MLLNHARLLDRIEELGRIGATAGAPGRTRLALDEADRDGRNLLRRWAESFGAHVSVDPVGNLFMQIGGQGSGQPVMTGSHIDTVVRAGALDGCYGVIAGMEVLQSCAEQNVKLRRPLVVAVFTNEEGVRFGPDLFGSRVYTGELSLGTALATRVGENGTVEDCLRRIGWRGTDVAPALPAAFVELHIEQGPELEARKATVGVVEAIQGHAWFELTVRGQANHAGTTPMRLRCDAGQAAMRVAMKLDAACREEGVPRVATVGRLHLHPGAINTVPGLASMTVDMRDCDPDRLQLAEQRLREWAAELEGRFEVTIECVSRHAPVLMDDGIRELISEAARQRTEHVCSLPSGASHDAQILASVCPTGMIFVPSKRGVSHNPQEFTDPEHLAEGADVLSSVLLQLAEAR